MYHDDLPCVAKINFLFSVFSAKMHLMPKWPDAKMHFCTGNCYVFCKTKNKALHLMLLCFLHSKKQRQCKNIFDAEHFPKENVQLCKNAFDAKMHFCVHFPLENVQHHIFQRKMFSITFSKGKCSAKQNVTNAFDAKMHLMRCKNAFLRTFYKVKCSASHFPKENVQLCKNAFLHHIFHRKMFSVHLTLENVQHHI